jgi:hypothetical protein
MISKFSLSLTPHIIASYFNQTLTPWVTGALRTPWDLILLKRVLYSRKTNFLRYEYHICHAAITCTRNIKDLGVFFYLKLYSHNHVDFLFSECIKLLGLIRSITFTFSSLDCLYVLYFMLARSKLEYVSAVWNSIASTDANKLERIQQKFASVCFYRFPPRVLYTHNFALEKLSLCFLCKWRHHSDALSSVQVYRGLKSCTSL